MKMLKPKPRWLWRLRKSTTLCFHWLCLTLQAQSQFWTQQGSTSVPVCSLKYSLVFCFFFKSASIECDFSLVSLHRSTVFQKNFCFWDKMCCFLLTFMWWKRTGYFLKDCIVFYVLLFFIYLFLDLFTLWTHAHFFRCILFIINRLSIHIYGNFSSCLIK